eukprot:4464206-Prorocentrum_lima.AAC.1
MAMEQRQFPALPFSVEGINSKISRLEWRLSGWPRKLRMIAICLIGMSMTWTLHHGRSGNPPWLILKNG